MMTGMRLNKIPMIYTGFLLFTPPLQKPPLFPAPNARNGVNSINKRYDVKLFFEMNSLFIIVRNRLHLLKIRRYLIRFLAHNLPHKHLYPLIGSMLHSAR